MSKQGRKTMYPNDNTADLKDANRKLRAQVKKLKNELREEAKRIKQLEEALARNFEHMTDLMEGITVEEAIRMTKRKRKEPKMTTKQLIKQKFRDIYCGEDND